MKTTFILFFCAISILCFSQEQAKTIILHPAVGKLIDNSEKITYKLFPEYKDSTFNSAYITKYNDTTFSLMITNIKNQTIEKEITQPELDKMYYQIDDISSKQKKYNYQDDNYNRKKNKRRHSGPNYARNNYIITESLVQLTIITFQVILALAYL